MRLFFLFLLLISSFVYADEFQNFKEQNFDRVVHKLADRTSLSLLTVGTLSSYALREHDTETRNLWVDHQRMSESSAHVGDLLGSGVAGVAIIGAQYFFDDNQNNWQSHARALVWQTATVGILKYSTGVQRPGNKNRYESFPSGHTATAFATATSLTYAYGWKAAVIAYPVAAFVGLSRLSDDMHWGSDVLAGAFVGFIVGRATYDENAAPQSAHWTPILGPGFSGLNYVYSF
jgi:hypothetical protein